MYTIQEHTKLKESWLTVEQQKELIKRFWGDRLIKFISTKGKYITYLVRK